MNTQNTLLLRALRFLKNKAGYLVSFVLGMVVMGALTQSISPYTVARWSNVYEDAILGSLITSDDAILKTGTIPQDILDWYASSQNE